MSSNARWPKLEIIMVNEEILGGLKSALSRGETLKQAMMSFYNSGYKKEEIEEAARIVQRENIVIKKPMQKKIVPTSKKPLKTKPKKTTQKVSAYGEQMKAQLKSSEKIKKNLDDAINKLQQVKKETQPIQPKQNQKKEKQKRPLKTKSLKPVKSKKVSNYEKEPKPKGKLMVFLLIFFLLFLIAVLAAVFLFREELVNFFTNLF